jgi:GxxExxY protein
MKPKRKPVKSQKSPKNFPLKNITSKIISCAIEVHSHLGPGLLESVYEEAISHEFELRGIPYDRQKEIGFSYKDHSVGKHRIDFVIKGKVVLELKAVNALNSIYEAQVFTYLKATGIKVGLLINFNVKRLKDGIKRFTI